MNGTVYSLSMASGDLALDLTGRPAIKISCWKRFLDSGSKRNQGVKASIISTWCKYLLFYTLATHIQLFVPGKAIKSVLPKILSFIHCLLLTMMT
jgi:hypothetical protein